jgi:hypothetical protein
VHGLLGVCECLRSTTRSCLGITQYFESAQARHCRVPPPARRRPGRICGLEHDTKAGVVVRDVTPRQSCGSSLRHGAWQRRQVAWANLTVTTRAYNTTTLLRIPSPQRPAPRPRGAADPTGYSFHRFYTGCLWPRYSSTPHPHTSARVELAARSLRTSAACSIHPRPQLAPRATPYICSRRCHRKPACACLSHRAAGRSSKRQVAQPAPR